LLLYVYTSPRTVALEDDGFFILTSKAFGIAHAPGYPLYTLLAGWFQYLPFGSLAWRIHAFSAVCGALTSAALWLTLRRLLPGNLPALTGALALGLSLTFWSQAIVAEVYTLATLLFTLALWLLLQADSAEQGRRVVLRLAALVIGLGLANHWPLLVLASPVLLVLMWRQRRAIASDFPVLLLCLTLGLTPYLWMIWRSHHPAVYTFTGPLDSLQAFWSYVSRSSYADVDHSPTADWLDKLGYIRFVLIQSLAQFAWLGGILALTGLLSPPAGWPMPIRLGLFGTWLASGILIALLLGFDDQPLNRAIFRVYPLMAWIIVAIWLAAGITWLQAQHARLATPAVLSVLLLMFVSNWPSNDRNAYTWAQTYAHAVLADLPSQTTLYLSSDIALGTVAYAHQIEGLRPDVALVSLSGELLSDSHSTEDSTAKRERSARLLERMTHQPHPQVMMAAPGPAIELPTQRSWLWYRLLRPHEREQPKYLLPSGQRQSLTSLFAGDASADPWTKLVSDQLIYNYGNFITLAAQHAAFRADHRDIAFLVDLSRRGLHGRLARLELLMRNPTATHLAEIRRLLHEAATHLNEDLNKRTRAKFQNALARQLLLDGRQQAALEVLDRSVAVWPDTNNSAVQALNQYYRTHGDEVRLRALQLRIARSAGPQPANAD
jgi:hypothetical protein